MKSPQRLQRVFLAFLSLLAVTALAEDWEYTPNPVLLVHGFNATPSTFGAYTSKEEIARKENGKAKDYDILSTSMIADFREETFDRDQIAFSLLNAFDDNNSYDDASANQYQAYCRPQEEVKTSPRRNFPWEEPESYSDINHTYVEVYCSYYAWESDDAKGKIYKKKFVGVEGDPVGYDISNGGQTQLLRIRIIQMLNEYYGDFAWVNDPSAKIKIVCHSNGGLITTNLLKNEEKDGWHNDGYNRHNQHWQDYVNGRKTGYVIDGYGFRLRDHVDQVVTIDTPFDGSPLANKDGWPSPQFQLIVNAFTSSWLVPLQLALQQNKANPTMNALLLLHQAVLGACIMDKAIVLKESFTRNGEKYARSVFNYVPAQLHPFVNIIHDSFDATHEREWRVAEDLKFEFAEVRFVFCPEEEFSHFCSIQRAGKPVLFDLAWLDRI